MIRLTTCAASAALVAGAALAHPGGLPHAHPHDHWLSLALGLLIALALAGVSYLVWRQREDRRAERLPVRVEKRDPKRDPR